MDPILVSGKEYLAALDNFDLETLSLIITKANTLYAQKCAPPPPEIWNLILTKTCTRSPLTFGRWSFIYESLSLLFRIRTVCKLWNNLIPDILLTIKTAFEGDAYAQQVTLCYATICGDMKIFDYLITQWDVNDYLPETVAFDLAIIFKNNRLLRYPYLNEQLRSLRSRERAITLGAGTGNFMLVQSILGASDSLKITDKLLSHACACGFHKVVHEILSDGRIPPQSGRNLALRTAVRHGSRRYVVRIKLF